MKNGKHPVVKWVRIPADSQGPELHFSVKAAHWAIEGLNPPKDRGKRGKRTSKSRGKRQHDKARFWAPKSARTGKASWPTGHRRNPHKR